MLASELGATSEPPLLTRPTSIKLSSTFKVSVFKIDCVPRTVKLPVIVALDETVRAPVTASVEPSKVKLPLSSSSPLVPANTTLPDVKSPIAAVSAARVSIFAVPSRCRSIHSKDDVPKSLAPSEDGTKSLSNLPVAVIVSLVALPRSTSPLRTVLPATSTFPSASIAPMNVETPETLICLVNNAGPVTVAAVPTVNVVPSKVRF